MQYSGDCIQNRGQVMPAGSLYTRESGHVMWSHDVESGWALINYYR
jgi:hypothetical protein